MKSLHLPVWLSKTTTFYVDNNIDLKIVKIVKETINGKTYYVPDPDSSEITANSAGDTTNNNKTFTLNGTDYTIVYNGNYITTSTKIQETNNSEVSYSVKELASGKFIYSKSTSGNTTTYSIIGYKYFTIDGNNYGILDNNIDENEYGKSIDNAWTSLAYAVNTIAKNYNINSQSIYVRVKEGTYTESITLSSQTRTTGFIMISPYAQSEIVKLYRESYTGKIISHEGGRWILNQLNLEFKIKSNTSSGSTTPGFIVSSSGDENLGIRRCNFNFIDNTTNVEGASYKSINFRGINATGGRISWNNMAITSDPFKYSSTNKANPVTTMSGSIQNNGGSDLTVFWIYVENGGLINFGTSDDATNEAKFTSNTPKISVSGSFSEFLHALTQGIVRSQGTGNLVEFIDDNTTGKKYNVLSGAIVTGFADIFPGSIAGTPSPNSIPGYISNRS